MKDEKNINKADFKSGNNEAPKKQALLNEASQSQTSVSTDGLNGLKASTQKSGENRKKSKSKSKLKSNSDNRKDKKAPNDEQMITRRTRKTKAAVCAFVLIIGVGVAGNWYWENSDLSSKISSVSQNGEKILGQAEYVDATTEKTTESEYFASARVDRQTARDESLEKLQKVIDSTKDGDKAHSEAAEKIASISDMISAENKIETLVKAKGIDNCLAVISEDGTKVNVIVDTDDLTDKIILQVKEITVSQLGCSFEDVTIIQSN